MYECSKGKHSFYYPFIKTLPEPESVTDWSDKLLEMIQQHVRETNSALAKRLVNDWSMEIRNFWHVVPHEILNTLDNPVSSETVIGKIA